MNLHIHTIDGVEYLVVEDEDIMEYLNNKDFCDLEDVNYDEVYNEL